MKSTYSNVHKICHARVGQLVRLPDPETLNILPEVFMVCAKSEVTIGKKTIRPRAARAGMSHGLYDDERPLSLLSLTTGLYRSMPHLSSRAELLADKPDVHVKGPVAVLLPEVGLPVATSRKVQIGFIAEGTPLAATLDMADPDDVRAFLESIITRGATLTALVDDETEKLLHLQHEWRSAVAAGTTLQSFEEYRIKN
jgi:hypothetical protein